MSRLHRRSLLAALGGSLAIAAGRAVAQGARVVGVRVWPARAYTRVTIESDARLSASHLLTPEPLRLVVDLDGMTLDAALRQLVGQVRPDDPYIAGVRVGQFTPSVVRLVFDLKQAVLPQQFALEPAAAYRHRLVFDLFPPTEEDPLLALLRDRERAEASAVRALDDALGELIARVDGPGAPAPAVSAAVAPGTTPGPTPVTPKPPDTAQRQRVNRLVIVALDPGHGGEDPGAVGPTGLYEKDVVLAIARQLRDRLHEVPGLRVMLTRDGDYYVPLAERVRKARQVQADLFVSIHADAFMRQEARGASVFALSDRGATSAAARWMADKENASDVVGGVNAATRDAQLLRTLLDMSTTAQIKDSLRLGDQVLQHLGGVGRLHKRRVEQAAFAVLKAPDIPSILVETAFISNPQEEQQLRDPAFQARLAKALAQGIRRYFAAHPPLARQRL